MDDFGPSPGTVERDNSPLEICGGVSSALGQAPITDVEARAEQREGLFDTLKRAGLQGAGCTCLSVGSGFTYLSQLNPMHGKEGDVLGGSEFVPEEQAHKALETIPTARNWQSLPGLRGCGFCWFGVFISGQPGGFGEQKRWLQTRRLQCCGPVSSSHCPTIPASLWSPMDRCWDAETRPQECCGGQAGQPVKTERR